MKYFGSVDETFSRPAVLIHANTNKMLTSSELCSNLNGVALDNVKGIS